MLKKLFSLLLVTAMLITMCCVAATTTNAAVTANTIYFQAPNSWKTTNNQIYCHIWSFGGSDYAPWQNYREKCTKISDSLWSYVMPSDSKYNMMIFSDIYGEQTYDLTYGPYCLRDNDTVYCTGNQLECPVDSTIKVDEAKWKLHVEYGPLQQMTSTGKTEGETPDPTKVIPVNYNNNPEKNTCTVTFESNGGSTVPSQTVNYNTTISAPTAPIKDNYTFSGWFTSSIGGTKVNFPYTVFSDTTLYAQWTLTTTPAAERTIYFKVPSSWGTCYKQIYCHLYTLGGSTYAAWQCKLEKCTKVSDGLWSYVVPNGSYNVIIFSDDIGMQTYDLTYGSYCLRDNDTVYCTGNQLECPADSTIKVDEAKWKLHVEYGPLQQMTSTGKTEGETPNPTKVIPVDYNNNPEKNTCTVTFDSNGGSTVPSQTANYNTTISAPTVPTKDNYTFSGWFTSSIGGTKVNFPYTVLSDTTLYAHWTLTTTPVASRTIYFQVPSTWGTMYKQIYCHIWAFNGAGDYAVWQSAKEKCTRVSDNLWSYIMPSDNKYNVLIFSDDIGAQTYDLTFGQYCLSDNDTVYCTGKRMENPVDSAYESYEAKWKLHVEYGPLKQITSTGKTEGETPDPTKVTPINYCNDTTYTVTFDSNGASTVPSQTVISNTTIIMPTAPTRDNFTFLGWYKDADCTTPWNFSTDVVQGDTTLYARWRCNTFIRGDVDQDGKISLKDATLIQKYLAKLQNLASDQITAGDLNAEGKVSLKDVTKIQKYLAGIISGI
ncbi:MAG: InlB B-repeat-containing protein [Bacillota bacterium]|nr:InlB B-repeat-containing protein [Bacillota bacterium]